MSLSSYHSGLPDSPEPCHSQSGGRAGFPVTPNDLFYLDFPRRSAAHRTCAADLHLWRPARAGPSLSRPLAASGTEVHIRATPPIRRAVTGSPTETIFYVHGVVFAAWFLLLLTQPLLVGAGRVDLHRRLGLLGGALAVAMLLIGTVGALIAAGRPTGFTNVPAPPLQFLVVPLVDMVLFGAFVTLALV